MSAVLEPCELVPWDLLVSFPWLPPQALCHSELPVCFSPSLLCASIGQVWSVTEWSCPIFWRLYPRVPRGISKQSDTQFSSLWPRSMWSQQKPINIVHSIERLHVMRMMESHVCTNRLRIHLKNVHPLVKLGNDFWWISTLTWTCCYMRSNAIQNNQKSKSLVSNLCRTMIQEDEISKIPLFSVHSRVTCLVSDSSNCRMDMSLPHAGKGHKPYLEYPSESFSSWTVQKTCGSASNGGPSSC